MPGVPRQRRGSEPHGDWHGVLRRLLLQLLLQPQLLLARCQSQNRLHDQSELHVQGGDQDHGRQVHQQLRRVRARHPGDRRPRVHHRWRGHLFLPGHRSGQPLRALRRAGRHHHRPPHLLLDRPGAQRLPLQPQFPLLPTGQEGRRRPVRRCGDVDGAGPAEHVVVLLPALAVAAHPVLHAAPVVPAHTLLHAAATSTVPVPAAADSVLHAAFTATTGFPFPFATNFFNTVSATAATTGIPFPSATNFLNTVSATAAAAASCIPIPFAADSTPTSFSKISATAVVVLTTASSAPAPATASSAFVSLAIPASTFLPANSKPFDPISSTFKALSERSKHLGLFRNPALTKYK